VAASLERNLVVVQLSGSQLGCSMTFLSRTFNVTWVANNDNGYSCNSRYIGPTTIDLCKAQERPCRGLYLRGPVERKLKCTNLFSEASNCDRDTSIARLLRFWLHQSSLSCSMSDDIFLGSKTDVCTHRSRLSGYNYARPIQYCRDTRFKKTLIGRCVKVRLKSQIESNSYRTSALST